MKDIVTAIVQYPQGLNKVVDFRQEPLTARFFAPNKHAAWRYKTLFIKEPETIEWLHGLTADDILWDVGANVGIYSIYAGLVAGCKVVAIEPGAANYWTLCKNVELNGLDATITTLCIALGEEHKCADLFMYSTDVAGAQNALDRPMDDNGRTFTPQFRQGMLSIPADVLIEQLGVDCPTAIKIDVDGFELPVLRGAERMFKRDELRRISLELNSSNKELVATALNLLEQGGFKKTGEHRSPHVAANSPIHNFHFERN